MDICFSPVAGIQWVETPVLPVMPTRVPGFSPVAGIQWVETFNDRFSGYALSFQSRCRDSVG